MSEKTTLTRKLGSSKEDLLLEAEIAESTLMEERNKKLEKVQRMKPQAQEHFERLSRQGMGEGVRSKQNSLDDVRQNADFLRTNNRVQTQSRREKSSYEGPTIGEMGNDQYTSQKVDG